jgi:predicted amidohydrolase YtcJ
MTALLLQNADVRTMDGARPRAQAVAVRDGLIVAVGDETEAAAALEQPEVFNCERGTLVPGLIDAHIHLLSYAVSLYSADCRHARNMADIQSTLRQHAARSAGRWVRGFGYEETALSEGRHPTGEELDRAVSDRPVRLVHGSGHASVLNSAGLRELGITGTTEEPPGGAIERDLLTGEPNGVLIEMEDFINERMPLPGYSEIAAMVRHASRQLLLEGITCICDASHRNGLEQWSLFERLLQDGSLQQDVVCMEGWEHFADLPELSAGGHLRRGPVKVLLRETGGLQPSASELTDIVASVHQVHRSVAIHAVGENAVRAGVDAIAQAIGSERGHGHRIEHCSVLPQGYAEKIAELSIGVVNQPSLIVERGDRYGRLIPREERERLYAARTLRDAGVVLAAGSDAPVTRPRPLASIAAAVERRSRLGQPISPSQAVGVEDALGWWTAGAARLCGLGGQRGAIRAGMPADLVLLPPGILEAGPPALREARPSRVWITGRAIESEA